VLIFDGHRETVSLPQMPSSPSTSTGRVSDHDLEDVIPIDKVVVLYASETGNSQDTAERVGREFRRYGKRCTVMSMELFDVVSPLNLNIEIVTHVFSFSCPTHRLSSSLPPLMAEVTLHLRCYHSGPLFFDLRSRLTYWQVREHIYHDEAGLIQQTCLVLYMV
jgi:hypothetical protein